MEQTEAQAIKESFKRFYIKWISPNLPSNRIEWFKFWAIIIGAITLCSACAYFLIGTVFRIQLLQNACQICEGMGNLCTQKIVMNFTFPGLIMP